MIFDLLADVAHTMPTLADSLTNLLFSSLPLVWRIMPQLDLTVNKIVEQIANPPSLLDNRSYADSPSQTGLAA